MRKTTGNDVCMVELGLPSLRPLIKQKQSHFFHKIWLERNSMDDDPLIHTVRLVQGYSDQVSRYINDITFNNSNDAEEAKRQMRLNITNSTSSRLHFYKIVNPNLGVHDIYTNNIKVNDIERVSWTRLRLSAHSLAVEKGRWNRRGRGRLPLEERLCPCGLVQTETHVIERCPLSLHLRNVYNITTVEELFGRTDYNNVCATINKILALYE